MRTMKLAHERADELLETKRTLSTSLSPSLAVTLIRKFRRAHLSGFLMIGLSHVFTKWLYKKNDLLQILGFCLKPNCRLLLLYIRRHYIE